MSLLEEIQGVLKQAADQAGDGAGILRSPEAQATYFLQQAQVLATLRLAEVIENSSCSCDQEEDSYDTVHPLFVVPDEVTVEVREDGVSVVEDPAPVEVTTVDEGAMNDTASEEETTEPDPIVTPDVSALTDVLEKVVTAREANPPQRAPDLPRIGPPASAPDSYLSRDRE